MFQFQTGSIRSQHELYKLRNLLNSFNSKLVRLEENPTAFENVEIELFQFQTGSIKSEMCDKELYNV